MDSSFNADAPFVIVLLRVQGFYISEWWLSVLHVLAQVDDW
jgi:hypothetical protein